MHDTELKYTPKGAAVCDLVLACNRCSRQDWRTSPECRTRSKISIVAEHVELKPQRKGKAGKDAEGAEAEGNAGETAPGQPARRPICTSYIPWPEKITRSSNSRLVRAA